jgi:hypothetical protein
MHVDIMPCGNETACMSISVRLHFSDAQAPLQIYFSLITVVSLGINSRSMLLYRPSIAYPFEQFFQNFVALNSDGNFHMENFHLFLAITEGTNFIISDDPSEKVHVFFYCTNHRSSCGYYSVHM